MILPDQIRVLIIDDNAFALKALEAGLRKLGIVQIVVAGSGAEGLAALMTAPFDVVLFDWYMPEVSGAGLVAVAQAMRQARGRLHADAPHTDLAIVTAYASPEMAAAAKAGGVRELLAKPFTDKQLAALMGRLMAGRGARTGGPDRALAGER